MTRSRRITLFLVSLALLAVVFVVTTKRQSPLSPPTAVIFTALLMISFVSLFLEHFFTRPSDVLSSTIAILLLLAPMNGELSRFGAWYWLFFAYNALLLITSLMALLLLDAGRPASCLQNRLSFWLKYFSIHFGNGRLLFFALFALTTLFYVDSQSATFLWLAGYAAFVLLFDPRSIGLAAFRPRRSSSVDVGEIIGVQSRGTFLARLYPDCASLKRFEVVEFRHSMSDDGEIVRGILVEKLLLEEQQWIKICAAPEVRRLIGGEVGGKLSPNIVYKTSNAEASEELRNFVGLIIEDSTIQKIRFNYAGRVNIAEGTLLQTEARGLHVLYQVTEGLTAIESLERKDSSGFVVGEAVQLGVWNADRLCFEKYGWVPDTNAPLFIAANAPDHRLVGDDTEIGTIPDTNYPVVLKLRDAITHHIAILGVTGSGKSMFCRDLLRKIVADEAKVICVDFTNEYNKKFPDLKVRSVVPQAQEAQLFNTIDQLAMELEKFPNQQDKGLLAKLNRELEVAFVDAVRQFVASDDHIALFELPDVTNSTATLEYTKRFFKGLFQVARGGHLNGRRVCVVLEEAHTIIPEWNFIGIDEKRAQSLVNSISQIALQGRKYSIGFIVVAQRTANVSKTVLTQCNTVIAFQQFDKTSAEFLMNYVGPQMTAVLPVLRQRQAVATGRGLRSGVPMIFQVPAIEEPAAVP